MAKLSFPKFIKDSGLLILIVLLLSGFAKEESIEQNDSDTQKQIFYQTIIPNGKDVVQQFVITEDVYQYSQTSNLSDIKIIDADDNPLPFKISNVVIKTTSHTNDVVLYPLSEQKYFASQTDTVTFKYDHSDRLSEIQSINTHVKNQVMGYILDLGEGALNSERKLLFQTTPAMQTGFLRFDIDQSNDMKIWTSLARGEVLAQLVQQDMRTEKNEINLVNVNSRYLRIKLLDETPAFAIVSAKQVYSIRESTSELAYKSESISYDERQQGFMLDLSPAVYYQFFAFELDESNSILSGEIYVRNNNKLPWRRTNTFNLFRIEDNAKEIIKNKVYLNSYMHGQLKIIINYPQNMNDTELQLQVAWKPQYLTFIANGNAPYKIVVGDQDTIEHDTNNQEAQSQANNSNIVSAIMSQVEGDIPLAKLGEAKLLTSKSEEKPVEIDWFKILLWFVLVSGAVLMGIMAKKLMKQL